ncbi:unnamed protein product [Leptidea sinapis]|uniref:PPAF-2-like Clip domain-containing protein n=1 Tax=Leptidea sinapis TaxID=189913 RepID=A0A5E4QKC3_9NEOP|nr:unnamed protein product [Leptidea sinapis]
MSKYICIATILLLVQVQFLEAMNNPYTATRFPRDTSGERETVKRVPCITARGEFGKCISSVLCDRTPHIDDSDSDSKYCPHYMEVCCTQKDIIRLHDVPNH